jgi:hypothetical protein
LHHVSICGVPSPPPPPSSSYATLPRKAKWSGPYYNTKMLHYVLFHTVTCYTKSIVSFIHVNTTKLHNITCTLVASSVVLRNSKCTTLDST